MAAAARGVSGRALAGGGGGHDGGGRAVGLSAASGSGPAATDVELARALELSQLEARAVEGADADDVARAIALSLEAQEHGSARAR